MRIALLLVTLFSAYAILTNPFNRYHIFRNPFVIQDDKLLRRFKRFRVRNTPWRKLTAYAKSAFHIVVNVYIGGHKTKARTIDGIIAEITALRVSPKRAFLISGDHFSVFYPRNLGIFYYPMLDRRLALGEEDWRNKQEMMLKSLAFGLEVFSQAGDFSTTIVPTGRQSVTTINIYAYPSDTLYSLLYGLHAMLYGPVDYRSTPLVERPALSPQADALLADYRDSLVRLIGRYRSQVWDDETGLIRTDLSLSGTKDITRRLSSFYDNVIYWKTMQLADTLGLITLEPDWLSQTKRRIISTFWLPAGHFLEDLSAEARAGGYYSSDWLVVLLTGFLSPADEAERVMLASCVDYIKGHGIDRPFPIRYHAEDRGHRQFHIVRWLLPEYGGSAIWSFWGLEYVKLLILLYRETQNAAYLSDAETYLDKYADNIVRFRGFPETYDTDGDMLRSWFYKSIRQTGWIVNYQQAREMLVDVRRKRN